MEPPNETAPSFLALHHLQAGSSPYNPLKIFYASASWSQGIGVVKSMEEKKSIRAQKPQALNCPRCNSSHTKFCYYNNYNLSQPRYFCKTCRRYWTAGGSLRNVPVGGGSRKTKRSSSSSKINHHDHMKMTQPSSLNLVSQNPNQHIIQNTRGDPDHLMGIFKTGNDYSRGMMMINSFMPMPVAGSSNTMMMNTYPDVFENDGGYDDQNNGNNRAVSTTPTAPSTSARLFFPFEDLKPPSASPSDNALQGDSNSNAYWIGGGSW